MPVDKLFLANRGNVKIQGFKEVFNKPMIDLKGIDRGDTPIAALISHAQGIRIAIKAIYNYQSDICISWDSYHGALPPLISGRFANRR